MRWQRKACLQNIIYKLPSNLSNTTYYFLQRNFGGLRNVNPIDDLTAGNNIARYIHKHGRIVDSKTFFEIGTGRRINIPIALWLLGASKIVSVDVNRYLKAELVLDDLSYMRNHQEQIENLFDQHRNKAFADRFRQLMKIENNLQSLLALTNIQCLAPVDASRLELGSQAFDYHISYNTLEHIPPALLRAILQKGKQLVSRNGLLVHRIDFSDHFSHSNNLISAINFLRFNDCDWERLAGNRYMYHNRLRIDDIAKLFAEADIFILSTDTIIERKAVEEIIKGYPLDRKYSDKAPEINATTSAWVVGSVDEFPADK